MKKMNNKGFSLVELIIVIAIMAILSAALAPQLMKYIEKSRVSTDKNSCSSLKSSVNTALTEESAYTAVTASGATTTFYIKGGIFSDLNCNTAVTNNAFATELQSIVGSWPTPKSSGANCFKIELTVSDGSVTNVSVDTNNGVMSK